MVFFDDGGKSNRGARCSFCYQISLVVGREQDREDDAFLQKYLLNEDEF